MSKKLAILCQTGFGAKSYPGHGSGIHELAAALSCAYPDRKQTWLGVRVHDAPADMDVIDIVERFDADQIIHVGHSFGTGHGLLAFAKALAKHNRRIDLACCIDPVPDYFFGHFPRNNAPFPNFPANVQAAWYCRTMNKPTWFTPYGRPVHHPNTVGRIVFGTDKNIKNIRDDELDHFVFDAAVDHGNIDDNDFVHDSIVEQIGRLA